MKSWKLLNNVGGNIASIMTNAPEKFEREINDLIPETVLPYSGIVISSDEFSIDGEQIEKRCYAKGGFKFIYKAYEPIDQDEKIHLINYIVKSLELISEHYITQFTSFKSAIIQSCWIVCQREGDYGTLHNHTSPGCNQEQLFSGMMYLSVPNCITPDTFPDGCLYLISDVEVIYVPPIVGSVTIWPSKILHGIHPFRGQGDRVGIAFNFLAE